MEYASLLKKYVTVLVHEGGSDLHFSTGECPVVRDLGVLVSTIFLSLCISTFSIPFITHADTTVSGTISSDTTWSTTGNVYIIQGGVTVSSGVTLTVDPGVIVKFQNTNSRLIVNGTLDAVGASTSTIYFTSYKDDSVGGDTNGDGGATSPAVGDWAEISINSGGVADIGYAVVRYGGNTGWNDANLYVNGGELTVATSTISNSQAYGIWQPSGTTTASNIVLSNSGNRGFWLQSGAANIASSTLSDNNNYGIRADGGSVTITDNDFVVASNNYAVYISDPDVFISSSGNTATSTSTAYNGIFITGTLNNDRTLYGNDTIPYVLGVITINSGVTLTVDDGVVVKGRNTESRIIVNGILDVNGSESNPVHFTSLKDDVVDNHDTGADGSTSPAAGNWAEIAVNSGGIANIEHAIIRYGGYTGWDDANLYVNGGTLTIATSTISYGQWAGIRQVSGTTTVWGSNIENNNTYGAYNALTATSSFTALNNYWGMATTGPYHNILNSSGEGDRISSYIAFDPWTSRYLLRFNQDCIDLQPYTTNENCNSVVDSELLWGWHASSTEAYYTELNSATTTWVAEGLVSIDEDQSTPTAELWTDDFTPEIWRGQYTPPIEGSSPGLVQINTGVLNSDTSAERQKTWTHELGHALGLDHHNLTGNVMYDTKSSQTTLGQQDQSDYHYLWGF